MQIHDEDGEGCGERDHGHGGHVVLPCGAENVVSHKEEVNTVEKEGQHQAFKPKEGKDVDKN